MHFNSHEYSDCNHLSELLNYKLGTPFGGVTRFGWYGNRAFDQKISTSYAKFDF